MRLGCKVKWLDGEFSEVVFLVNTVSYFSGKLSIYVVENNETYFEIDVTEYDFHSIKRQLLEEGFAYVFKIVSEKLWDPEVV